MKNESDGTANGPRPTDDELRRLLRGADPVASETPLQPGEEDRIRRTLDHASEAIGRRRWGRRGLVALATAATLAAVLFLVGHDPTDRVGPAPQAPAITESQPEPEPGGGGRLAERGPPIAPVRLRPLRLTPSADLAAPQPLRPTIHPGPRETHRGPEFHDTHLTAANGTRIVWSVSVSETPGDGSRETRS